MSCDSMIKALKESPSLCVCRYSMRYKIMSRVTNVFLIHHKTNGLKVKDEHFPFRDIQLSSEFRILYFFLFYLLRVNGFVPDASCFHSGLEMIKKLKLVGIK